MESKQLKWILLAALSLIWGSSFILIKRGLVGLTPLQLGSLRMLFAASFLIIVGFKKIAEIPLGKWKYIALTALMGTFIPVFLFALAQSEIDSSISAVLNSLTPLNTLILGILFFGMAFQRSQLIGVLIGLLGSLVLILSGAAHHPEQNYFYALFVVIATFCYATNVNLIKKYLSDINPIAITVGNFIVMVIPALIILISTGFFDVVQEQKVQHSVLFIAVLGIIGTGIANILFFKLIQITSPVFASSSAYLFPIVAIFWGLLDGETLSFVQIIGAAIILFGIYLSAKK
ncbi:permease of the drug/metabolite transporter (DMT) superfamily [Flavobacterium limnosediminis JC2902]|uniref:Permease of the drug/metabolite transporter (DMT) superfamily n=1 Tax=Flavobacterium limnosediminis JC2902 TaxID=1341181 RepID=V6SQP0_9FLAO|nr:DMT family transporter [Flavobacterium limnosediminis]ESU28961.1 permease of the drug/metabolite transporter (DMT) superfamily [Flavobacterium limnosediminis JC2902]